MEFLAADRVLLLTYACWMLGGCLLLFSGTPLALRASAAASHRPGTLRPLRSALALFCCALVVSTGLFLLGQRDRMVSIDGTDVVIQWGVRLPMTLHRYTASDLTDFTVTEETRFLVTNLGGTGDSTIRQGGLPNRWRVTATYKGDTVNLGSYASDTEAYAAVEKITTVR